MYARPFSLSTSTQHTPFIHSFRHRLPTHRSSSSLTPRNEARPDPNQPNTLRDKLRRPPLPCHTIPYHTMISCPFHHRLSTPSSKCMRPPISSTSPVPHLLATAGLSLASPPPYLVVKVIRSHIFSPLVQTHIPTPRNPLQSLPYPFLNHPTVPPRSHS